MDYPDWSFFPRSGSAPQWVVEFTDAVRRNEKSIASPSHNRFESDQVLEALRLDLEKLGWLIETEKRRVRKFTDLSFLATGIKRRLSTRLMVGMSFMGLCWRSNRGVDGKAARFSAT